MVDVGFDENAASEAASRPLQLVQTTPSSVKFGYFTDAVIEEAIQVLKDLPAMRMLTTLYIRRDCRYTP